MNELANGRVLVIDDEQLLSGESVNLLKQNGYAVTLIAEVKEALDVVDKSLFDIVFCNVHLFGDRGSILLQRCKTSCPETAFIMMEKQGSVESCMQYIRDGASDYLSGSFDASPVLLCLNRTLERKQLQNDNLRFREELGSTYDFSRIIGQSTPIRSILEKVKRVANTKSTVLITGDTGTGKELIAKAIHYNSPRRNRPIVTVNCASIPQDLLESELFGHVRGSFTGAVSAKKGLFEEANNSTLFLDEIGDMDVHLQVKILRAIEDEEIRRVGDTQRVQLDIRVIAATNTDLSKAVEEGKFRKDLFYRLNVVSIYVPPLRERREDIPLLAYFSFEKYKRKHNRNLHGFRQDTLRQLMECDWPGNVRELENAIEQAVVMADEPWIDIKDVSCLLPFQDSRIRVSLPSSEMNLKSVLKKVQETTEEELITRVVQECAGNRTQAAVRLGISRRALLYKLKTMKLNDQKFRAAPSIS